MGWGDGAAAAAGTPDLDVGDVLQMQMTVEPEPSCVGLTVTASMAEILSRW